MATIYRGPHWILPQLVGLGGCEILVCLSCLCYSIYVYRTHNVTRPNRRQSNASNGSGNGSNSSSSRSSSNPIASSLKYMNFIGVSSFLCCSITQCINIWYWNVQYDTYSAAQTMTWFTTWLFWSTGIFMTYLLFLHRIRTTFTNSSFEPSQFTLWSLYILLTLYAILWLTVFILPILIYVPGSGLSREEMFDFQWKLSVPIAVVDILLSVSMTYIFVSRLYSLILMQTAIHYDESLAKMPGSTTMKSEHSLRRRTHKMSFLEGTYYQMIRISVKIGILAIVSLTSSLILLGLRVASFYLSYGAMVAKVAAMWLQVS